MTEYVGLEIIIGVIGWLFGTLIVWNVWVMFQIWYLEKEIKKLSKK